MKLRGRARQCAAVVAFALALGLAAAGESRASQTSLPPPKEVGDLVPPMRLQDLKGVTLELRNPPWAGPVLLFFWSVYCPNCKDAMPGLVRLGETWEPKGLAVWAVNVDGDRFSNAVRAFAQQLALQFPVVFDRLDGDLLVAADALGVSKTPTLILAGADGRILLRQAVDVDYEAVQVALKSALTR